MQITCVLVAIMPAVTVKNLPDDLYQRPKTNAQAHHRSINGELIAIGGMTIGALALIFLPFLDKNTERSRRIVTWAGVFALLFMVVMTLIALLGGH